MANDLKIYVQRQRKNDLKTSIQRQRKKNDRSQRPNAYLNLTKKKFRKRMDSLLSPNWCAM